MTIRNHGLAFPESNGRIVFADLHEEDKTEKNQSIAVFKFANRTQWLPNGQPTENAIVNYATDSRGSCPRALRDHFCQRRYELIVSARDKIDKSSYGLISLLALLLSYRRRALMTETGTQNELMLAATGIVRASGEVKAIGDLKAKLGALIADNDDARECQTYRQRVFVMPDQALTDDEAAMVKTVRDAGWTVLQIGDVADPKLDVIWAEPVAKQGETESRPDSPLTQWRRPVAIAASLCAVVGFALFYPTKDSSYPLGVAGTLREAPLPNGNAPAKSVSLRYAGTLKLDVVPITDGQRTLAVAPGHLFSASDRVDLDVSHTGPERAAVMLFREGTPTDRLVIEAGQTTTIRRGVEDLIGPNNALLLRAGNCATDCTAELAAMVVPVSGIDIPPSQQTHVGKARLTGSGDIEMWASIKFKTPDSSN